MKKRVLQLTGSFQNGGTERQACGLARALNEGGEFDITLATLDLTGPLLPDIEKAGFTNIPEFRLTSFFNAGFVRQAGLCSALLQEKQIDLIHTHDFYTNVFGMTAASLAGTRVKVASKRETSGVRSKGQDFVEKVALGRADKIVANSQAVELTLVDRGIRSDKIEVIYNGLEIEQFSANEDMRHPLGIPNEARLVTLVANLRHPVKNIPMFLRVARSVGAMVPDVVFVIAGEGGLQDEFKDLASNLGVADKTYFIGRCDDIPSLLYSSYACVLTSTAEGFSNSIIEYMAAAKPVVATNVGGAGEAILECETGYLVDSDDDEAMTARLLSLLSDETMAAEFGEKGRLVVEERFSREAQLENTSAMYRKLLKA